MMKKIVLTGILLFAVSFQLKAQRDFSTSSRRAIEYYRQGYSQFQLREYEKALEFLDKAIQKDDEFIEAYIIKAQVYEEKGDLNEAVRNYRIASGIDPDYYPRIYYSIGILFQNQGEYDNARESFRRFLEYDGIGPVFKEKTRMRIEACNYAIRQLKNPVDFNPVNLGPALNSEYNEYWPSISADGKTLVITRLIPIDNYEEVKQRIEQMEEPRKRFFKANTPLEHEDFYVSYKSDTSWSRAVNMGKPINTDDNEGAQSLSADGKTMYFTACNRNDGKGSCDIYVSRKKEGEWSKPVNIGAPVNTSDWESQPSISPDGRTLYFASGRKGGKGKKDIWKSTLQDDSAWSKPVNLGDSINTIGEDMAPFIHMDNQTLYFASDGWQGMGNLDLFKSKMKNDSTWSHPENLGYPINTHKDEVGLIVDSYGTKAYYASNRNQGKEKDIYTFDLPESVRPIPSSYMKGRVYDAVTGEPLSAHFVLISMKNEKTLMESYSDKADGEFLVSIPSDNNYVLNVSKIGYLFYSDNFQMKGTYKASKPFLKDIPLKPIQEGQKIVLRNVFYELDSYQLREESKVELNKLFELLTENPNLKIEISGHTDSQGSEAYNEELSEKRARSVYNYLIDKGIDKNRLTYRGYGENQPVAPNDTAEGRAKNRRTEIKVIE